LIHLLSFQLPPPLHYLHSFPTRRSSDLSNDPYRTAFVIEGVRFGLLTPAGNEKKSRKNVAFTSTAAPRANSRARIRASTHPPKTDRKSTRLNSSHVSISYAVFCLKKKKK